MSKRYDKEFKIYAAKLIVEEGKKAAEVARELDIAQQTLSKWVLQYHEDHTEVFVGSGYLKPEDKATSYLHSLDKSSFLSKYIIANNMLFVTNSIVGYYVISLAFRG